MAQVDDQHFDESDAVCALWKWLDESVNGSHHTGYNLLQTKMWTFQFSAQLWSIVINIIIMNKIFSQLTQ